MNDTLHSLFSGAFYINEMYGMSCVPTLYKSLINDPFTEKTKEQLIENISSNATSQSEKSDKKVIVLKFKQPVLKYDYGYWLGTQSYIQILEYYKNNPNVAGVVFDTDSGGGQVYGTGEFYDYILSYPKPTAVYTNGYLCSGAYYFAAPTDYIVANPRADAIGSIGAYSTIIDSTGIWEHFGGKVHVMYGTKSTGKNSEYREVVDNSNYKPYIKNNLDPIIETFHTDMKTARPQLKEEVFDGSTWTGKNSLTLGLIDETGTLQTAIDKVFELSKSEKYKNNTQLNNSKNNPMSKLNVPLIEAVIGASFSEGETENGIILTDEQALAIENRLSENNTAIANAETEATTSSERITELEAANTTVTTAIQNALATAEVEGAATMNNEEGITALSNLVAEYGAEDGAEATNNLKNNGVTEDNPNVISGIDVSAAMNN
ncbi:Protease-4 [Tenacibaculum maritimum]|uniref:S49 family peptidase n=1 Tax=Tenacibaculum maritimum TaxID=107401 RepID=UPI0012E63D84|nr:S49 family peptidase [Tenacibaculum maritimum]CAA0150265.1 Protease-4 [Tenacibaculum maritimum]